MPKFPLGGGVPKGILGPVNEGIGPVAVTVTAGVEPTFVASLTVILTVAPTFVCGISLLFGGFAISSLLLAVLLSLVYILPLLNNIQLEKMRLFSTINTLSHWACQFVYLGIW